jgi:hypothetical protein
VEHRHRLRLRRHSHRGHEVADLTGTVGASSVRGRAGAVRRPLPPVGGATPPKEPATDNILLAPPCRGYSRTETPTQYLALQTKTVSKPGNRPEATLSGLGFDAVPRPR